MNFFNRLFKDKAQAPQTTQALHTLPSEREMLLTEYRHHSEKTYEFDFQAWATQQIKTLQAWTEQSDHAPQKQIYQKRIAVLTELIESEYTPPDELMNRMIADVVNRTIERIKKALQLRDDEVTVSRAMFAITLAWIQFRGKEVTISHWDNKLLVKGRGWAVDTALDDEQFTTQLVLNVRFRSDML